MSSMKPSAPLLPPSPDLDSLLTRGDIWQGLARQQGSRVVVDTGYPSLNTQLLDGGWPTGGLIEICQQNLSHSEWLLILPTLRLSPGGYWVLLNPPAIPFAQAFIQAGMDLERLLIVQTQNKADFLASFLELARAQACDVLLAWQPQQTLSYTELRKCLLATLDGSGLYLLFRPASVRQQNSPANLRLLAELTQHHLQLTIFKQKGVLHTRQMQPVQLPLPEGWQSPPPYPQLDKLPHARPAAVSNTRKTAIIKPLRGGKR